MDTLFGETDFCTLLLPTFIIVYIGQFCVKNSPKAKSWSEQIAFFSFVLFLGNEILTGDVSEPLEIAVMSVSAFLKALLIVGLCYIFLPLPLSLFQKTTGEGFGYFQSWKRKRHQRRDEKREERERIERQRQSATEWAQNAPKRERQQREQQQLAKSQADQQRRREEVRLRCQLLYDQHAQDLRENLSPERLEAYFSQYLSDQHSAEMVEQRGELLQEMIAQSLGTDMTGQSEFNSIQEIAIYFREQRTEIEKLEYDVMTRQTIQAALSTHEDTLIRSFMSRKR